MRICYYHGADLDGKCCGAILKLKYGAEISLRPIDYDNMDIGRLLTEIPKGAEVALLDFTLQPFENMFKLNSHCELVWIDHHKTAIEAKKQADRSIRWTGLQQIGEAGCELTWKWFFDRAGKMPRAVELIGRYDVWDHEDPAVLPFQYGMRARPTDPRFDEGFAVWHGLLRDDSVTHPIIDDGRKVLNFINYRDADLMATYAFVMHFEGLLWICYGGKASSTKFASVYDRTAHAGMLAFFFAGEKWQVNLYTENEQLDVSAIAAKHGGGGHAKAAGFMVDELPFDPVALSGGRHDKPKRDDN